MGEGWGVSEYDCEICPTLGTLDFDDLCLESGFGSEGEDIDECKILPGLCANGQCINTMGSYRCICNRGFRWTITIICNEIDIYKYLQL